MHSMKPSGHHYIFCLLVEDLGHNRRVLANDLL